MSKILYILIFFVCLPLSARLIPPEKPYPPRNFVGIGVSGLSGNGVFYKYMITRDIHLKGTGFIFTNTTDETSMPVQHDSWYNFGAEFHYNILNDFEKRFYLTVGGKYRFDKDDSSVSLYLGEDEESQISAGMGLGFESLTIAEHTFLNFEIGFQYFESNREIFISGVRDEQRTESGIALFIGLGISYNF